VTELQEFSIRGQNRSTSTEKSGKGIDGYVLSVPRRRASAAFTLDNAKGARGVKDKDGYT